MSVPFLFIIKSGHKILKFYWFVPLIESLISLIELRSIIIKAFFHYFHFCIWSYSHKFLPLPWNLCIAGNPTHFRQWWRPIFLKNFWNAWIDNYLLCITKLVSALFSNRILALAVNTWHKIWKLRQRGLYISIYYILVLWFFLLFFMHFNKILVLIIFVKNSLNKSISLNIGFDSR